MELRSVAVVLGAGVALGCNAGDRVDDTERTLTGTLVKEVGRDASGAPFVEHRLKVDRAQIRLQGDAAALEGVEPNRRVTLSGRYSTDERAFVVARLAEEPSVLRQPLSASAPKGSVAVFLVRDSALSSDPYSAETVVQNLFEGEGSANRFFQEVSHQKFSLSGRVFGWYTADLSDCAASYGWLPQAMDRAAADGFASGEYRHAIGLYRRNGPDCFYSTATIGTPDGVGEVHSFVNSGSVLAHELGHNLGLLHANSLSCTNSSLGLVPYGARCREDEYYDPYDAMGFDGYFHHFNSYSKQLQGWLWPGNVREALTPGDYSLGPQERASKKIQSLLVPIPRTADAFHVELRERFGFDDEPRFDGAVLVRKVSREDPGKPTQLLDLSPDGSAFDAGLAVGQTFTDPLSGIELTLVSREPGGAVVRVRFDGARCDDGVSNGDETGVDCGGSCGACPAGSPCAHHRDCESLACSSGECVLTDGGLSASYYVGAELQALQHERVDPAIDFDWGGVSPDASVPYDGFSARWTGTLTPPATESYTLRLESDDGARLALDGDVVMQQWDEGVTVQEVTLPLVAGRSYAVELEYQERRGSARIRWTWSAPSVPHDLVSPLYLSPAARACTFDTATELGPRGRATEVPSDACLVITEYPEWWRWGDRRVVLQTGPGAFPVELRWQDRCTAESGEGTLENAWEVEPLGTHESGCPVLIDLRGEGTPLWLVWW